MLTPNQQERYLRNTMLPGIGAAGQERLLSSRVLVIGCGGLGSPAALYLAAAGVGTLGLADGDRVELSNLQRQVLHGTADLGRPKVASASDRLAALNPDVRLVSHPFVVDAGNIGELIAGYDFVIDATDNFTAKFLINDACVAAGKPFAHGGILEFRGQSLTVLPGQSACYRCIFPEPPPDELQLPLSRAGVLGVLPGIIGTIQAAEAIAFLLGSGETSAGRLLTVELLPLRFRQVPLRRTPACPACGSLP